HCDPLPEPSDSGVCLSPPGYLRDQQQWVARTWDGPPFLKSPTAQMLVAEVAATPASSLTGPGLGLGICFQVLPVQRMMMVFSPPVLVIRTPTAQALPAEVAATESRKLKDPGLGLGTSFQVWPFQCSIRVLSLVAVAYVPTAQALLAEVAATALRPISLTW